MNSKALPTATPASVGISPITLKAILKKIDSDAPGVHSIIMMRHNKVILKAWHQPFREELPHMLYSLSKSFTSTAIGMLIDEGKLHLSDKLVSFFPDALPALPCENMQKITIEDLLTMRSGHSVEPEAFQGESYIESFLRSYVDLTPGTRFVYNTPATYMLSSVVTKLTGQTLLEYLTPRLFEPLGIEAPRWDSFPSGKINMGGYGLNLKTEDLAKFGTMLLNHGEFFGKRIVSAEWVNLATAKHAENYGTKDWGAGYGFQFWRCVPDQVYRGDGAFGQYCLVLPKEDMVIVMTAGSNYMQEAIDVLWQDLLPALSDMPLPEDSAAQAELDSFVAALSMPIPQGERQDTAVSRYSGITYALSENEFGFESIRFDFNEEETDITLTAKGREHHLVAGFGEWKETQTATKPEEADAHTVMVYERAACVGCFISGSYMVNICYNTTPYTDIIMAHFDEQGLVMNVSRNLSLYGAPPKGRIFGRKS